MEAPNRNWAALFTNGAKPSVSLQFIAGVNDDISKFVPRGNGVEKYLSGLQNFETAIMGRRTYEFGYQLGLVPEQPAYPHMEHHIFSETLKIDELAENVQIEKKSIERIKEIRERVLKQTFICVAADNLQVGCSTMD